LAKGKRDRKKKKKRTAEEVFRDLRLPTSGEVVFTPPRGWHPSQPLPRGPQNGYMDAQDREWTKGPTRTTGQHFEWDVQLPAGGHLNVDWDGNITHPKPRTKK
jgi:filamentous hemagglutinin